MSLWDKLSQDFEAKQVDRLVGFTPRIVRRKPEPTRDWFGKPLWTLPSNPDVVEQPASLDFRAEPYCVLEAGMPVFSGTRSDAERYFEARWQSLCWRNRTVPEYEPELLLVPVKNVNQ